LVRVNGNLRLKLDLLTAGYYPPVHATDNEKAADHASDNDASNGAFREMGICMRRMVICLFSSELETDLPGLVALAEHPYADLLPGRHEVIFKAISLRPAIFRETARGADEARFFNRRSRWDT